MSLSFTGGRPPALWGSPRAHRRVSPWGGRGALSPPCPKAVEALLSIGISGPYGLALGPDSYTSLVETTEHGGLIVFDHIRQILQGPIVWAPGVRGAVVLSLRGGDFVFEAGEDLSLGLRPPRCRQRVFVPRGELHLPGARARRRGRPSTRRLTRFTRRGRPAAAARLLFELTSCGAGPAAGRLRVPGRGLRNRSPGAAGWEPPAPTGATDVTVLPGPCDLQEAAVICTASTGPQKRNPWPWSHLLRAGAPPAARVRSIALGQRHQAEGTAELNERVDQRGASGDRLMSATKDRSIFRTSTGNCRR